MGHKILLADDSITIQKVIELTFSDEDFELHTVGNGQKAIDEIRAIQPDIVLCDIIMPEKNGYEVCEFIKSNDELKHIPVLLLTGAFEPFDQERAKAAGCEGFLAKPFEPQTLISKVKELLAGAQSAPAGAQAPPPPTAMPPEPLAPAPLMPDTMQSVGPLAGDGDETVLVPPPAMGAPPPVLGGPQVPVNPTAPPADPSALGEAFAVEAGERELAMDSGDHTVLLGANDSPDVPAPPATPPGASDDIWSDAGSTIQPEPPEPPEHSLQAPEPPQPPQAPQIVPPTPKLDQDDGATVFMAQPPSIDMPAPPSEASLGGPVDNEMSVGHEDPEATWQMPPSTPELPPAPPSPADLGGFEDFAAAPPAAGEPPLMAEPPAMDKMDIAPPPTMQDEPPAIAAALDPGIDPFAPDPPELGSTNEVSPVEITPDSIPSVDTQATMDPVKAGGDAFTPMPSTPAVPEPPQIVEMPATPMAPETPFAPVEPANELETLDAPTPAASQSPPEAPIVSTPPSEPEPAPVPEALPEVEPVMPVMDPVVESPPSAAEAQVPATGDDDDLVERVAQRVVDKLSAKIIQEIAWEVVPDLAEGLIRREIDVLKSKITKSG
ncbi:MAG: hypothetical protein BMS9Abin37_0645 [Acidobacteriota bacterium]|nr:MAG: hypothetical protein BMS9Abin37_0645 [Acidobacteriota bacterium]